MLEFINLSMNTSFYIYLLKKLIVVLAVRQKDEINFSCMGLIFSIRPIIGRM